MSKVRYTEIKEIKRIMQVQQNNGQLTGQEIENIKANYSRLERAGYELGYFVPAGSNWSYTVVLISVDGQMYKCVGSFGNLDYCHKVGLWNFNSKNNEFDY